MKAALLITVATAGVGTLGYFVGGIKGAIAGSLVGAGGGLLGASQMPDPKKHTQVTLQGGKETTTAKERAENSAMRAVAVRATGTIINAMKRAKVKLPVRTAFLVQSRVFPLVQYMKWRHLLTDAERAALEGNTPMGK